MGRYLDIARKFDARKQVERQADLQRMVSPAPSPSWPCSHCGQPATIEAVEPSLDGKRMLTFWHCEPCQTYAVTPDPIREPPVWVRRIEQ